MPEILEIEAYRRLAERSIGRPVAEVRADDAWYLKGGTTAGLLRDAVVGATVVEARRRGKLLLLDTDRGPVLGLRFGMTGRLLVDGNAAVDQLLYSSLEVRTDWDRFALGFDDGGSLWIRDPRRLGGVELDPDEDRLGPDAWQITEDELAAALASRAPLKARLMDQRRVAGLGNLLTDEVLWRAGFDPARPAESLQPDEVSLLHEALRTALDEMSERGGSHTGGLQESRVRGATCPKDGTPLERRTIGGRTTYSCPAHQR